MKESDLTKLLIYLGIFALAIILIIFDRNDNKNSFNNGSSKETNKLSLYEEIDEDYYKASIYYYTDDDALTLNYEKSDDILIGSKKYHSTIIDFIYYNNKYYDYKDTLFSAINDFDYFDFDKTFIDLKNIKKLLNKPYEIRETNQEKTLKFKLKDVLILYNEINDTNYIDLDDEKVSLKTYYDNNVLDYILLDITSLYNKINNSDKDFVVYKLKFSKLNKEDMSFLKEKLN